MNDPVAVALKFGFLAVLYLFLLWVARSSLRDLAGRGRAQPVVADGPVTAVEHDRRGGLDPRSGLRPALAVVAALGREPGELIELGPETTMGRAANVELRVDDPYASSSHARLYERGSAMYIEDMGSTNGTYLNGHQLTRPQQLEPGDTIRIGDSEYRYQE